MRLLNRWMWLSIISEANTILQLDPDNKNARMVKDIAGLELINAGYPSKKTNTGYEIEIGGETLYISEFISYGKSKSEEMELAKLRAAFSTINSTLSGVLAKENVAVQNVKAEQKPVLNDNDVKDADDTKGVSAPVTSFVEKTADKADEGESCSKDPLDLDALIINTNKPENQAPKQEAPAAEDVADANAPKDDEQKPDMTGYKDNLEVNDFLFSYHNIVIHQPDSSMTIKSEVIISPLYIKEGEVDVMAWINDGTKSEVGIAKAGRSSVLLQLGAVPVIASGRFEDGKFIGEVSPTKVMKEAGVTIDVETETFNGKGHILISDEDISVRMVPISFKNSANGNAQFFYAIKETNKEPITGDNISSDKVRFDYKGEPHYMLARWKNDVLYSSVRPV